MAVPEIVQALPQKGRTRVCRTRGQSLNASLIRRSLGFATRRRIWTSCISGSWLSWSASPQRSYVCAPGSEERFTESEPRLMITLFGALVAALLLGYLLYAMLAPEKF